MSPCCIAAATATAVMTALIVVGLTAFVLVTDGLGLVLLLGTALAVALPRWSSIGPCPQLLFGLSALLGGACGVAARDDAPAAGPGRLAARCAPGRRGRSCT